MRRVSRGRLQRIKVCQGLAQIDRFLAKPGSKNILEFYQKRDAQECRVKIKKLWGVRKTKRREIRETVNLLRVYTGKKHKGSAYAGIFGEFERAERRRSYQVDRGFSGRNSNIKGKEDVE